MPTKAEIQTFLLREFPQTTVLVDEAGDGWARVRQPVGEEHLRPGGTVSGPTLMAVADVAAYVAVLAAIGIVPLAVTTNLNINFLNKPAAGRAIIGEAALLKLGKRLAVIDVRLYSEGEPAPVAQASVTYSIPPAR